MTADDYVKDEAEATADHDADEAMDDAAEEAEADMLEDGVRAGEEPPESNLKPDPQADKENPG